jgi:hypothetical protein
MTPSSGQGLLPIHVSRAELPILLGVALLVLSAVGLTFWSLGRRSYATFFGSRGLLTAQKKSDPYLPPPRVLPRSAHEQIQDPKYLRGILEAERRPPPSDPDKTKRS